ncbi:hypothetical protein SDC9_150364 [bioreactor metagenome]|uniref:Uncharacterized protein n=1 Tax=bioreactor metagenome TaxID=1076179 RepID=A0A645EMA1_9ZZZZ
MGQERSRPRCSPGGRTDRRVPCAGVHPPGDGGLHPGVRLHLPAQRHPRHRGGPPAPEEAVPPHPGRRAAGPDRVGARRGDRHRGSGPRLRGVPRPGHHAGDVRRGAVPLLLLPQGLPGHRPRRGGLRLPAAGRRRRRRERHPAQPVVPAGRLVRLDVHGRRQALFRDASPRSGGGHPQVAGRLHRELSQVRLGTGGRRRGDVLFAVGLRPAPRRVHQGPVGRHLDLPFRHGDAAVRVPHRPR